MLFHTQMPSLIAATLASEKPTDGYLVNDIVSILVLIYNTVIKKDNII